MAYGNITHWNKPPETHPTMSGDTSRGHRRYIKSVGLMFNLDKCICCKCGRVIQDGEHKLSLSLSLEEVLSGSELSEIISRKNIPSLCLSCSLSILREIDAINNVFNMPEVFKPTTYRN